MFAVCNVWCLLCLWLFLLLASLYVGRHDWFRLFVSITLVAELIPFSFACLLFVFKYSLCCCNACAFV